MSRGVIVGKLYPPHAGHAYLIEQAVSQCDEVTVIVCWKEEQTIPGETRAAWLREMHPGVRVLTVWDFGRDDDSEAWARATIEALGYTPDVAFTSEKYGDAFARWLGCRHVCIDLERGAVPVSGTLVRADPFRYWEYLSPAVRAWYALRVAIVGAESTGTTTLARALAEHYGTVWVPEYGREYCEAMPDLWEHEWRSEEFTTIACEQLAREDAAARECNRVVVCDTDALATGIWHERYMGGKSEAVRELAEDRIYALTILTDCDIPFEQDGLRDGEDQRGWMTRRFREELEASGRRWICVKGSHADRMEAAINEIDWYRSLQPPGPVARSGINRS